LNFAPSSVIGVGDPIIKVYTIVPPTCDRIYCPITNVEIVDAQYGLLNFLPGAAIMSSTCASPVCFDVDVFSTDVIAFIYFKVKTTFYPNLIHVSDTEV